jgi:hypothetical protein
MWGEKKRCRPVTESANLKYNNMNRENYDRFMDKLN